MGRNGNIEMKSVMGNKGQDFGGSTYRIVIALFRVKNQCIYIRFCRHRAFKFKCVKQDTPAKPVKKKQKTDKTNPKSSLHRRQMTAAITEPLPLSHTRIFLGTQRRSGDSDIVRLDFLKNTSVQSEIISTAINGFPWKIASDLQHMVLRGWFWIIQPFS